MTDAHNGTAPTADMQNGDTSIAAAPPKPKRSFFKKAAWQTAPKNENDDADFFSHRKEIARELEEENRLKREKRRKEQAERKKKEAEEKRRQSEERRERKRRKISLETEDELPRSGSTTTSQRKSSKRGSRSPNTPIPVHADSSSLTARYDSLTKSSSSQTLSKPKIIDLGDSDEDDAADEVYNPPAPRKFTESSISVHIQKPAPPSAPVPSNPLDDFDAEDDDPELAAVLASARERARAREAAAKKPAFITSTSDPSTQKKDDGPIVELFVTSEIPNTKPLCIKARANHTLGKIRLAWCGKQGFSDEETKEIFLTWKNLEVVDSTKITRLGIQVDEHGGVTMENAPGLYDENNPPKIHIEAWTEETFEAHKREEAEKKAAARKGEVVEEEVVSEPEPEPEVTKIRLILKAKSKQDFKIAVKPTTTIEQLASAYKQRTNTPEDQPITLMFDGERLRPMDTIADTDIEDMECVEVHFK